MLYYEFFKLIVKYDYGKLFAYIVAYAIVAMMYPAYILYKLKKKRTPRDTPKNFYYI